MTIPRLVSLIEARTDRMEMEYRYEAAIMAYAFNEPKEIEKAIPKREKEPEQLPQEGFDSDSWWTDAAEAG